jgi:hypothetical protein
MPAVPLHCRPAHAQQIANSNTATAVNCVTPTLTHDHRDDAIRGAQALTCAHAPTTCHYKPFGVRRLSKATAASARARAAREHLWSVRTRARPCLANASSRPLHERRHDDIDFVTIPVQDCIREHGGRNADGEAIHRAGRGCLLRKVSAYAHLYLVQMSLTDAVLRW